MDSVGKKIVFAASNVGLDQALEQIEYLGAKADRNEITYGRFAFYRKIFDQRLIVFVQRHFLVFLPTLGERGFFLTGDAGADDDADPEIDSNLNRM